MIDTDAIWRGLRWKADGDGYKLYFGSRRMGRVVPDQNFPGMWRVVLHTGGLSDMANLTRCRDAAMASAVREIEYERRAKTEAPIPSASAPVFRDKSSDSDPQSVSATTLRGEAA